MGVGGDSCAPILSPTFVPQNPIRLKTQILWPFVSFNNASVRTENIPRPHIRWFNFPKFCGGDCGIYNCHRSFLLHKPDKCAYSRLPKLGSWGTRKSWGYFDKQHNKYCSLDHCQ